MTLPYGCIYVKTGWEQDSYGSGQGLGRIFLNTIINSGFQKKKRQGISFPGKGLLDFQEGL
jgi:hypothetical protein